MVRVSGKGNQYFFLRNKLNTFLCVCLNTFFLRVLVSLTELLGTMHIIRFEVQISTITKKKAKFEVQISKKKKLIP